MGLVLLIVKGALLGWLVTIAFRIDSGREIGRNIALGSVGSVLVGVAVADGMVLGSVSATTLLYGLLGAAIFVGLYNFIQYRRALA